MCENQATVGVDLGVLRLATFSTGETVEGPKPLRRLLTKLQRCSRQLSRKVKGSRNRAKARDCLARLHARIASQRKDALHKLSTDGCDRAIPNPNLFMKSFSYKIKHLLKNIVLLYSTGSHANAFDAGL